MSRAGFECVRWSNIAYVVAGVATQHAGLGVLLTALAVASWLYHSEPASPWRGAFDVAMMYGTMAGMIAALAYPSPWFTFAIGIWVANIIIATHETQWWRPWKVVAMWTVLALCTALSTPAWPTFAVGVGAFVVGGALWLTDKRYVTLGHTLWHMLTALGFAALHLAVHQFTWKRP